MKKTMSDIEKLRRTIAAIGIAIMGIIIYVIFLWIGTQ